MDKDRIVGSAKDMAGKVEGAVGDLTGDASTQASGRARAAAGTMQNLYGQAKDAGETALNYAKDALDSTGIDYRQGTEAVARQVKDNPMGALLIAGGIGFALAMLLSRPAPRRRGWR